VAATDQDGKPAPFTNYGPWVRASALGVNVVSLFFQGFNGAEPPQGKFDPDHFEGWALWSGTSFSAPRVVAALAKQVGSGATPRQAVKKLIDNEKLPRHPMLGTAVDPTK
jgi:subtilisin family serine protease